MRIDSTIELRGNDYHVEVSVGRLSPLEQQLISQFGGPSIETGGTISATVSRPPSTTPPRTSGIAAIPTGVTTFAVSFGGELAEAPDQIEYSVLAAPTANPVEVVSVVFSAITTTGFTANLSGPLTETGYRLAWTVAGAPAEVADEPVAVQFTLPQKPRRLPDEFPIKYVVSLDDDAEADLKAAAWKAVIEQRLAAAKLNLLNKTPSFVGETSTTI